MDTQTILSLATGLLAGAAIVQSLRHSAAARRASRVERERDEARASADELPESLARRMNELHAARNAALQDLADRTRQRDEARTELADLAAARDETIRGLQSAIAERGAAIQALLRDLGAALEQRDAATVARDQAQRELAERTADRDGADLAHADCERRLADMGDRFAALQAACQELREQIVVERAAAGAAQERSRMLDHEVESLKASLAASKAPVAADRAAGDTEAAAAAPVARKSRRRA